MDPLPDRVETVAALDDHLPGIGAFSTLCVYPFADISGPGWDEAAPLTPVGEYANSCVGRERVFQHGSERYGTPGRLIRLNYAIDLRYGILHEIAFRVLRREPIDHTTPLVNIIWQGDAVAQILRTLRHCTTPTSPLNIGGPDHVAIEDLAYLFAARFGKEPIWQATSPPPRGSTIRRKPRGFSVRPPSRPTRWSRGRPTGLRKAARVADIGMITAFAAIRPGVTCGEAIAEGWRRCSKPGPRAWRWPRRRGLTISTAAKTRAEQRELLQTVQADPRPEA